MSTIKVILFCILLLPNIIFAEPVNIGLVTKIWPFMWVDGKNIDDLNLKEHQNIKWKIAYQNLSKYPELNANFIVVDLYQSSDGADDFKRVDKIVSVLKEFNINPVFRLYEDIDTWYALSENESKLYGYNKEYFNWIREVAARYEKDVKYYLISNEVELGIGHRYPELKKFKIKKNVDYDQYLKLVNTASRAIKGVNNKLKVVDHGPSNYSLGLAVAMHVYENEGITKANSFWSEFQDGRNPKFNNDEKFRRFILSDDSKKRIDFLYDTYTKPGNIDFHQFHYYRNWKSLQIVLDYLNEIMLDSSAYPLFASEVGFYTKPNDGKNNISLDEYAQAEHADAIVKDFIILMCNGVSILSHWGVKWHKQQIPLGMLYQPSEDELKFDLTKAGSAFKFMANTLNETEFKNNTYIDNSKLWGCQFSGKNNVEVLWGKEKSKININLDDVSVYDTYGKKIVTRNNKVSIGLSPIYLIAE